MAKSKSILDVKGFEQLLDKIDVAEKDIEVITEKMMSESMRQYKSILESECSAKGVPSSVISDITLKYPHWCGNTISGDVGWKLGTYDPHNLSQGYKAIFLNYGTPHRSVNGQMKPLGFIQSAKKKAKSNVKKSQEETLNSILGGLKK